ncbi:sulfate permease [Pseudomonadales bacterium]|nr:sulfate permease [Pseudomonadales bacterium]MDB9879492.1 sulfate permease [Pseudomonadales bacterium]MDB9917726.1 sulfate permease [Pseudomonadales bacterium]
MKLSPLLAAVPLVGSLRGYNRESMLSDLIAGLVVTAMLIPQSLAYALLAGVPAEVGMYASILPLVAYAIFGTSRTLSVGPVAIASLMTAVALGKVAETGSSDYVSAAVLLAFLSGGFLIALGVLRLGFLANFLSHTVVSGFITASGILIALSQMKHIAGVKAQGDTFFELLMSLLQHLPNLNYHALTVGVGVVCFLFWARRGAAGLLAQLGMDVNTAQLVAKAAPVFGIIVTIAGAVIFDLAGKGVALVGEVPAGLPSLQLPVFSLAMVELLIVPAMAISIIGYVESISVGKTLGAKRGQRVDGNQELVGLGAANLASSFSGGFPVTGGFSRSVVNFDAGASTQLAGILAAVGIALASLFLTPVLFYLPQATLAATIIVAVTGLIDVSIITKTWKLSKSDFYAVALTILGTLVFGVEAGVAAGVLVSLCLYLYRTSKPHIAEVGLIEGTEHFRNILRHKVSTRPEILSLRVDENLFFANAGYLEEYIYSALENNPEVRHLVLMCSACNTIDYSALEVLEAINGHLRDLDIAFHLSEVKGPVMDHIKDTGFLEHLTGNVYLSQYQAYMDLSGSPQTNSSSSTLLTDGG